MGEEKTEKPTGKRLSEARRDGNVLMSKEAVTIISLFAIFWILRLVMPRYILELGDLIEYFIRLSAQADDITPVTMRPLFFTAITTVATLISIPMIVSALVAIVFTMLQTRMLFTMKPLRFKPGKLNPLKGMQKFFKLRAVVDLLKSIIKITVLMAILYNVIKDEVYSLARLMYVSPLQMMGYTGTLVIDMVTQSGIFFIFLAGLDFFYQRYEHEKGLKMTKQEIKEEYKQTQGDPKTKGRIRNIQTKAAMQRMMQKVPDADVIVRNPTHFAVAISYDPRMHIAPVVVAKGEDHLALRIIALGERYHVPVIENRPLAQALYKEVPLDAPVPASYYHAIAEIFVFLHKLNRGA